MSRPSIARAVVALVIAVGGVWLTVTLAGFAVIGGAVAIRVGSPGGGVELARAILPIIVSVLLGVLAIRFGIRALRKGATLGDEFTRGGKLLSTTAWTACAWLAVELWYRQLYVGPATLFGSVGVSLVWWSAAVALVATADRVTPWSRAPRGIQHLGLAVVFVVALLTALSGWSHRNIVSLAALIPVALVGFGLLASGVERVESGTKLRMLLELGLASSLLTGPIWRLFS